MSIPKGHSSAIILRRSVSRVRVIPANEIRALGFATDSDAADFLACDNDSTRVEHILTLPVENQTPLLHALKFQESEYLNEISESVLATKDVRLIPALWGMRMFCHTCDSDAEVILKYGRQTDNPHAFAEFEDIMQITDPEKRRLRFTRLSTSTMRAFLRLNELTSAFAWYRRWLSDLAETLAEQGDSDFDEIDLSELDQSTIHDSYYVRDAFCRMRNEARRLRRKVRMLRRSAFRK